MRNYEGVGINFKNIVAELLKNENLLKLLYYEDISPLSEDKETPNIKEIYNKLVKIVPRVSDKDKKGAKSIISLKIDGGRENSENTEFQDIALSVEIFVPLEQWLLEGYELRPFKIMGEIKKSLNNKAIEGIGRLKTSGFNISFLTEETGAYMMSFSLLDYD